MATRLPTACRLVIDMAGQDIIQQMLLARGQSREGRIQPELDAHFVDVDERSTEDLLLFLKKFSQHVRFYADDSTTASGDWQNFFPFDSSTVHQWLDSAAEDTPAHLGLLLSFLELYKKPQEIINRFTANHLDFYYADVLRLNKKSALNDRAHVSFELKKNAAPVALTPDMMLSAGKDDTGKEMLYRPTSETVINHAKVFSLRSMFIDPSNKGVVRYAPIAKSSDGLGGELDKEDSKWRAFGYAGLSAAETGFALSSPVLHMQEGVRVVSVTLGLSNITTELASHDLTEIFKVYISGEKNWIGPEPVTPELSGNQLSFELNLTEADPAVTAYDSAVHGYNFETPAPVLQVFLNTEKSGQAGYETFRDIRLNDALIKVTVKEFKNLVLESDTGSLNAAKAFFPFGPQPGVGSRFLVGCDEALSKKLSELEISIQWKGVAVNLDTYYQNYSNSQINNSYFTAGVTFKDAGSLSADGIPKNLFHASDATQQQDISFSTTPAATGGGYYYSTASMVQTLSQTGSSWALSSLSQTLLMSPIYFALTRPAVEAQQGFITFSLNREFQHRQYRQEHTRNLMNFAKSDGSGELVMLNEPYSPEIQSIKLSYTAQTDRVEIASINESAFANQDVLFFQLSYFGQRREHAYQRDQFNFLLDKTVTLLPKYTAAGELLIGLESLQAGDSVSLLFQVAEGSANPDLPREQLCWSVLCDNYWRPLGGDELISDSSNQLLTSGIIKFVIPKEATLTNTVLPAGKIWLKASVGGDVNALCQMVDIVANVIEVEFNDQDNDPMHLSSSLPAGSIKNFKRNISAVKKLDQPYASFGGRMQENDEAYRNRVAERLRHKDRAISGWDIERLVLEQFPRLHKVKCIPHARPGHWLSPGHISLIVVPTLQNKNAINPLEPRADSNTLSQVLAFVQQKGGMQLTYHVHNPSYQKLRAEFSVRFKTGFEFNYYSAQLNQTLKQQLSPWVYDSSRDISFGGRVYKSALIDFVEELEYVDYVTDFNLYSYVEAADNLTDVNEVYPVAPDAILVSDSAHVITESG